MTKTLKRSIGITFILILISALSGGGITLGMAVFSGHYIFTGIFFLLYILLFLIALIYSSSNVIFALPCKKFLRTLFFVLWLISYSVLSYCLLFAWIFLGFRFSDICWNINYLMNHCLNPVAILMIPLKWFWVFLNQSEAIFRIWFHSEILKFLPQNAVQNGGGKIKIPAAPFHSTCLSRRNLQRWWRRMKFSRFLLRQGCGGQAASKDGVTFILRFA